MLHVKHLTFIFFDIVCCRSEEGKGYPAYTEIRGRMPNLSLKCQFDHEDTLIILLLSVVDYWFSLLYYLYFMCTLGGDMCVNIYT